MPTDGIIFARILGIYRMGMAAERMRWEHCLPQKCSQASPASPDGSDPELGNMKQPCKIIVEIYPPVYEIDLPTFARRSLTCPLKYISLYVLHVL